MNRIKLKKWGEREICVEETKGTQCFLHITFHQHQNIRASFAGDPTWFIQYRAIRDEDIH